MRAVMLFLSILTLVACGPVPSRKPLLLPPQPTAMTWEALQDSSAKVAFTTLTTGKVQVPTSGMLDQSAPAAKDLVEDSLTVSVFSHWLKHPERGDILIDSGLDERFRHGGQGSYKGLIASFIVEDSSQQAGKDIGSQLAQHGIEPAAVFLTHIHGDHTAGLPAIPGEYPVIIAKGESLHDYPLIMYNDHLDNVETLYELSFEDSFSLGPLDQVVDVFGDQSLLAIATPGHTDGNLSFLVNSTRGWVLLTGDASHTRWGFEHGVAPGWSEDDALAESSLEQLREFARLHPEVRVIFGHEQ